MASLLVIASFTQDLSRRADVTVILRIVGKGFPGKDISLATRTPVCSLQGPSMALFAQIMTERKIIDPAISAVG